MQTVRVSYTPVPRYVSRGHSTTTENTARFKLTGRAASPGIIEGRCSIIRNVEDLHNVVDGAILVCEVPSPDLASYIPFLHGLVAERGGGQCIAAGYAREYEIPAVLGVSGVLDALRDGDIIRIVGAQGTVEVIS